MVKNKFDKKILIYLIIGLVVGLFIGGNIFGKSATTESATTEGQQCKFCYNNDPEYYAGNSVDSLPSDWQSNGISWELCRQANSGRDCHIASIRPTYVTNKINCICKK